MSVKVDSSIVKPDPKKQFPLLARCKQEKFIVYFTSNYDGIVLTNKNISYELLSSHNDFVDVFAEAVWEILPMGSKVTLTLTQE